MNLCETDEESAFRHESRRWLSSTLPTLAAPADSEDWPARRRFDCQWQRTLFDGGYAGLDWPTQCGGRGLSPIMRMIFLEECERAGAPYGAANYVGTNHAGPTIIARGTTAQQSRFLPPILRGDEVWCQGFSEPDAGSDLASLRTVAVRDGDDYVVTGSKVWTSHSPVADFCEMLVRTDPAAAKHRGITWLIVPMTAAGITVRPLRTIMGSSDFAEVFLDEVRVPVDNRVGEENDGWRVAQVTLEFERGTAYTQELWNSIMLLRRLANPDDVGPDSPRGLLTDAGVCREVGHLWAELYGLRALMMRTVSESAAGEAPSSDPSVFKLRFTELRQRLTTLASRCDGRAGLLLENLDGLENGYARMEVLRALSLTIAGGTSQIQRNIIAERVLGLPRSA